MSAIETIGIVVLVLLVVWISAIIVPKLLGKSAAQASEFLSSSRDYDGDGTADFFDKCACEQGDDRNDGCPAGQETKTEEFKKKQEVCREQIKKSYKT